MTALIVGALIAVAAVVLVALPFLRREQPGSDDRLNVPSPADEQRLASIEARDRALGALKELEFDHRTGKIGDEDYRALVGPLRRAAAEALRALDADGAKDSRPQATNQ